MECSFAAASLQRHKIEFDEQRQQKAEPDADGRKRKKGEEEKRLQPPLSLSLSHQCHSLRLLKWQMSSRIDRY